MGIRRRLKKYELLAWLIPVGISASATVPCMDADKSALNSIEPSSGITTPEIKVMAYGQNFSPETILYFGGLQVRETKFISPNALEVVTPYLRQGVYKLQLKTVEAVVQSEVTFTALSSAVDKEIDRAVSLSKPGQANRSFIEILKNIAMGSEDYQVRAFAHYQASRIYFTQGDWWRWAGEAGSVFDEAEKSGPAVQTFWRYRLSLAQSDYFLPTGGGAKHDLVMADWMVEKDVTQDPEPRFFRSLVNARHGHLDKAKADLEFILQSRPDDPSYKSLMIYLAALSGEKIQLQPFVSETTTDARALSLRGQAAYLIGDFANAQQWWATEATIFPLGGNLAYLAAKKHLEFGEDRVAAALLAECSTVSPDSKEGKEARDLLAELGRRVH
jgi:tetratricopeptide (TPR) repeat protein